MLDNQPSEYKNDNRPWIDTLTDFLNEKIFLAILASSTAVGIIIATILTVIITNDPKQIISVLPIFVSIVIMIFKSKAMRIAPLIGSINSLFYAVIYFTMGFYSTALSCLIISFPIQMITLILWSGRKSGKTTKFRKFSANQRLLLYAGIIMAYIPWLLIDIKLDATSPVFDAASSLFGFVNPALTAFAFTDYTYLSAFSSFLSVPMHALNVKNDPIQTAYLIYGAYSLICEIIAIFNVHRLYKAQIAEESKT